jgi:replication fork protection complex subunit Tof1/Swi1
MLLNSGDMCVCANHPGIGRGAEDEPAIPDVEDEEPSEEEEAYNETMFTFEAFEMVCSVRPRALVLGSNRLQKLAHPEITRTFLAYLAHYKDFTSPEQMKRVVNLLHRQAVKVKSEGLFFDVNNWTPIRMS